jgi:REP element-mobilizing transposase RayT
MGSPLYDEYQPISKGTFLQITKEQDIFFDDDDRYHFYFLLQQGMARYGHRIHGFCLMGNHVHLEQMELKAKTSKALAKRLDDIDNTTAQA